MVERWIEAATATIDRSPLVPKINIGDGRTELDVGLFKRTLSGLHVIGALRASFRACPSPARGLAPGDQTPDSLPHVDLGAPAEDSLGQAVIHRPGAARAQLHLARLGGDMFRREVLAGNLGDKPYDLEGGDRSWS